MLVPQSCGERSYYPLQLMFQSGPVGTLWGRRGRGNHKAGQWAPCQPAAPSVHRRRLGRRSLYQRAERDTTAATAAVQTSFLGALSARGKRTVQAFRGAHHSAKSRSRSRLSSARSLAFFSAHLRFCLLPPPRLLRLHSKSVPPGAGAAGASRAAPEPVAAVAAVDRSRLIRAVVVAAGSFSGSGGSGGWESFTRSGEASNREAGALIPPSPCCRHWLSLAAIA